jgi:hypothetical protein
LINYFMFFTYQFISIITWDRSIHQHYHINSDADESIHQHYHINCYHINSMNWYVNYISIHQHYHINSDADESIHQHYHINCYHINSMNWYVNYISIHQHYHINSDADESIHQHYHINSDADESIHQHYYINSIFTLFKRIQLWTLSYFQFTRDFLFVLERDKHFGNEKHVDHHHISNLLVIFFLF